MGSSKYVGYVGGVAVAVGVGAAIAAASQGVASADTDKPDSSSASDSAKADAGPKKAATGASKRTKPVAKVGDKVSQTGDTVKGAAADLSAVSRIPAASSVAKPAAAVFEAAQVDKLQGLFQGTGRAAPKAAAAVTDSTDSSSTAPSGSTPATNASTPSVPWSLNPFRPMPPEPAPQDMPGPIWTLEQSFINVFPDLVKPVAREGFEFGYRLTQMVPWVNLVVPLTNIVSDLPNAFQGDKLASQRVINNLIVTINPVAVLYYGYNEVADVLNVEAQALQLQTWAISTAWNILDPFALLHIRGEAGLPLATTTPPPYPPESVQSAAAADQNVVLAAAVTPTASQNNSTPNITLPAGAPDPFRANDPAPIGMPGVAFDAEKALVSAFPAEIQPIVREVYEASWRVSQMVPGLNAVIPLATLAPALFQAALGDKDAAQVAINNVLLTTTALSILYYAFDEIADLLNVEDQAQALKSDIYAQVWNEVDPNGLLHVLGHSGIPA
ncbi:hypothetical protein BayCH28_07730 [Mycolicibacterium sp. CH28]|uniref:hypothetical protein n=1 Tax=Mycolicibacterium sp. CH28 TaxID=2512237 RepID=UPI0010817986|nr:hypothetical protein [Mycolicibacterium sp. CH28]TGD89234.1 hypothetical protein BayCH28_07730 [Mycolicibacterium sp. CH28]